MNLVDIHERVKSLDKDDHVEKFSLTEKSIKVARNLLLDLNRNIRADDLGKLCQISSIVRRLYEITLNNLFGNEENQWYRIDKKIEKAENIRAMYDT